MLLHVTPTETLQPLVVEPDRLLVRVEWQGEHGRPPLHHHPAHQETFEVLTGTVAIRLGNDTDTYGPGRTVTVPRWTDHSMWPVDGPASATWECRPAGRALEWFRALDAVTRRGDRGVRLALARGALAGRYDDVFRLSTPVEPVVRSALRAWAATGGRLVVPADR